MPNPLHAPYYADQALSCTVPVLENVEIARNTYRLRFESPQMARRFLPGQFLMLHKTPESWLEVQLHMVRL